MKKTLIFLMLAGICFPAMAEIEPVKEGGMMLPDGQMMQASDFESVAESLPDGMALPDEKEPAPQQKVAEQADSLDASAQGPEQAVEKAKKKGKDRSKSARRRKRRGDRKSDRQPDAQPNNGEAPVEVKAPADEAVAPVAAPAESNEAVEAATPNEEPVAKTKVRTQKRAR